MSKPEQLFWGRLRPKLIAADIYVERVENLVGSGKPDVDTLWRGAYMPCELKAIPGWPARARTPVLGAKKGLRQSQLNWFLNWRRHNGRALIVVDVARSVFTFDQDASEIINDLPRAEFERCAVGRGVDELITILKEQN